MESRPGIAAAGGYLWVGDDHGQSVYRLDPRISIASNRVVETLETAANPAVVAPVDGEVWATMFDAGAGWRIKPG